MTTPMALGLDSLESAGPVMVWIIVLSFVFVECAFIIGLFLPGDALLFTAGLVLARQGRDVDAAALAVIATVVAIAGNQVGFYLGRSGGTRLLARRGAKVLSQEKLDRARQFLNNRGFLTIVLARWVPWIRTLAPAIAGTLGMHPRRFLAATSVGAVAWVPTLVLGGYYGAEILAGMPWLVTAGTVIGIGFFVVTTAYGLWRYRREMRSPAEDPAVR